MSDREFNFSSREVSVGRGEQRLLAGVDIQVHGPHVDFSALSGRPNTASSTQFTFASNSNFSD